MRYTTLLLLGCLITPVIVHGSEPTLFHPNLFGGSFTTDEYVNGLYLLAISLAAILAVLKLIWAGVQYMLTDIVTKKEDARSDIRGALLGLVIILAAVTILNSINPNLTNLNFLRNAETVEGVGGGGASGTDAATAPGAGSQGRTAIWSVTITDPSTVPSEYARCIADGGAPSGGTNLGGRGTIVNCYQP